MKSSMSSDAQMPENAAFNPPPTTSYSPSVPISVYRELSAELQATKAAIDTLNAQNQHLVQQNQKLRRELEKLAQSALHARQVAEMTLPMGWSPHAPLTVPESLAEPGKPPSAHTKAAGQTQRPHSLADLVSLSKLHRPTAQPSVLAETYVVEQEDKRPGSALERSSDLNGAWLAIAIALIVLTAFGAGFLIVRPFLPNR